MAARAYRRRRDGVLEIVGPSNRLRDLVRAAGLTAAVLGFSVALALALAFYLVIGVPLAIGAIACLAIGLVRRRRSRRVAAPDPAVPVAPVEPLRRATPARRPPPRVERCRDVRPPPRHPDVRAPS